MPEAIDPSAICRHEDCGIPGIHRAHLTKSRDTKPHHRPRRKRRDVAPPVWKLGDPEGLSNSVYAATSMTKPVVISEIVRDVRDDYGDVAERTVYRHVRKLVEIGRLLHVDFGLMFGGYIRPGARLLSDPEAMRDIIESTIEYGKGCTGRERYA